MTTLHRGPRNADPLEAVAKRRHAELDEQFDRITHTEGDEPPPQKETGHESGRQ